MPFFYIISGYCSSEKNFNMAFKKYFLKYFKALYIPHFIVLLIYQITGVSGIDFQSEKWLHDSLMNFIAPHSEWFIPTLFASKVLFYPIYKLAHKANDTRVRDIIYLFVIGLSFYIAELINDNGFHAMPTWLPLALDCGCIALAFVIAGSWLKEIQIASIYEKYTKSFMYVSLILTAIVLWCIKYQTYTNVNNVAFGHSSISYFAFACVLSMAFVFACRFLCDHVSENNICVWTLSLFGRHTLVIYAGHTILFHFFNDVIYTKTGLLYQPMLNFKWSLVVIYFTIGAVILGFVCFLYEKLRKLPWNRNKAIKTFAIILAVGTMVMPSTVKAEEISTDTVEQNIVYINSVDDFLAFRDSVNAGNTYESVCISLETDLDLSEIENFEPIGVWDTGNYFYGTFDGNGHSIYNLTISREDNTALFPILGGTVCNLKIASGTITGSCCGSIASHATDSGAAKIINCINFADVYGDRAGGIADNFNGEIIGCINYGTVTSPTDEVGGIVSYDAIEIKNCASSTKQPNFHRGRINYSNVAELNVIAHNFRLGIESVEYDMNLMSVYQTESVYFSLINGKAYALGRVFYYIEKYFVDVACILLIMLSITKLNRLKMLE